MREMGQGKFEQKPIKNQESYELLKAQSIKHKLATLCRISRAPLPFALY